VWRKTINYSFNRQNINFHLSPYCTFFFWKTSLTKGALITDYSIIVLSWKRSIQTHQSWVLLFHIFYIDQNTLSQLNLFFLYLMSYRVNFIYLSMFANCHAFYFLFRFKRMPNIWWLDILSIGEQLNKEEKSCLFSSFFLIEYINKTNGSIWSQRDRSKSKKNISLSD
jgi:hypothetical protein